MTDKKTRPPVISVLRSSPRPQAGGEVNKDDKGEWSKIADF